MKILISDPDSKISLGIIRSLGLKNYEIEMFHNHKRHFVITQNFVKKLIYYQIIIAKILIQSF